MTNRLVELTKTGQSIWFDNMQRSLITTGELKRMVEEEALRGVTSNPTIFEKAITGSKDYDEQLKSLITAGLSVPDIYEKVVLQDIGNGADVLLAVFDKTDGHDGFISLEVNPRLAYKTAETIDEASRLFTELGRKNVMIKIPASQEGIPAIEESIYRGININITMIFSIENYEQVAGAYIRGLERRLAEGKPVTGIGSVASFFVSRVDTMVDTQLDKLAKEAASDAVRDKLLALRGKAAIANAKVAYQHYKAIFHGPRFAELREAGAMVQRQLWASTGTKNPAYSDLLYVDSLIGPETVDTVPPATMKAFLDHGTVALTLESGVDEARQDIAELSKVGIDLKQVTEQLQKEGLAAFVKSFDSLEDSISAKRAIINSGIADRLQLKTPQLDSSIAESAATAEKSQVVPKIWKRDASLWKSDADAQKIISNALGWLKVAGVVKSKLSEITGLADELKASGKYDHVMVCGMGGSSLCPEVLRQTFGKQPGYPELLVLDSTDPDTIGRFRESVDPARCVFIISSKSGSTTEPNTFFEYWWGQVSAVSSKPGENFIAITDPGTSMEKLATEKSFRKTYLNPADIGGRYSALSFFGMVPAGLAGIDVAKLLERAESIGHACSTAVTGTENPGLKLGLAIGTAALSGRDKLTFVCSPEVESLGLWIEQLIAESTGKEDKGILPVAGESLGDPSDYGSDRVFVDISVGDSTGAGGALDKLVAAGHPVIVRKLRDVYDLAEEFFLWEFATAVAGWKIGINPFDQPNVQEAKDATKAILHQYAEAGSLEGQPALLSQGALSFYSESIAAATFGSADELLTGFVGGAKAGDYIALLNFINESSGHDEIIDRIRMLLRDATHCATTTGYGPRYLHSTGQLHKGGPDTGLFIQITSANATDIPVPNEAFSFLVLKQAQALGDLRSLAKRGRRAIRVDLGSDVTAGLTSLEQMLSTAVGNIARRNEASAVTVNAD